MVLTKKTKVGNSEKLKPCLDTSHIGDDRPVFVGVDPGLRNVGLAILDSRAVWHSWHGVFPKREFDDTNELATSIIPDWVISKAQIYNDVVLGIEDYHYQGKETKGRTGDYINRIIGALSNLSEHVVMAQDLTVVRKIDWLWNCLGIRREPPAKKFKQMLIAYLSACGRGVNEKWSIHELEAAAIAAYVKGEYNVKSKAEHTD